jgi:uncharacterized protein (TIGR04255 family)
MATTVLKRKPLVEAILEIKWRLATQPITPAIDPNYRLFVGRFHDRVINRFPIHEILQTAAIPEGMAPHLVQYRFRSKNDGYPLLQIGPGILTLNDTDSYVWDEFESQANWALSKLIETFPEQIVFDSLTLRYIDGVEVDFSKESVTSFLKDKLKVGVSFPDPFFESGQVEPSPTGFVLQSSFKSHTPEATVQVKFAKGKVKEKDALVWETVVASLRTELPNLPEQFPRWLFDAHTITHDWFFKLIEGELLRRFE